MATAELIKIEITHPYLDKKKGDVLEMTPFAAGRFVNTGYAKRIGGEDGSKAMFEPTKDKAVKSPARAKAKRKTPTE